MNNLEMPPPPPRQPNESHRIHSNDDNDDNDGTSLQETQLETSHARKYSEDTVMERQDDKDDDEDDVLHQHKRRRIVLDGVQTYDQDDTNDTNDTLHNNNDNNDDDNEKDTLSHYEKALAELKAMVHMGVQAHENCQRLQHQNTHLKEEQGTQLAEITRLRAELQRKHQIITNLLEAVETAKSDTRQASRTTAAEATLRLALTQLTAEKDQATAVAATQTRLVQQLQDQLSQCKAKLTRVTQEKFQLAREQRVAITVSQQVDHNANADVEFYKTKVTHLTGQLQALNTTLLEKTRQNQDMQRQLELSLSRQAAAQRRAAVTAAGKLQANDKTEHDDDPFQDFPSF